VPLSTQSITKHILNAGGHGEAARGYAINPMPDGFVLTYKDITPGYFTRYDAQNTRVDPADVK
jgi:hypothetical protein